MSWQRVEKGFDAWVWAQRIPPAPDGHKWYPKLRYLGKTTGKARRPACAQSECFTCDVLDIDHHPGFAEKLAAEKEEKRLDDMVKMYEDWWVT